MFYVSKFENTFENTNLYAIKKANLGIYDELPTSVGPHNNISWTIPNEYSVFDFPVFVLERKSNICNNVGSNTVVLYANSGHYLTIKEWQRGVVAYERTMIKYIKNPSKDLIAFHKLVWEL